MSCNNVQILNFNHNVVEIGSDNKLIITDNVKCNSITIPQPVTNILQINSPGPQGPKFIPYGSEYNVLFKSGSDANGSDNFTFNYNTNLLSLTGSLIVTQGITGSLEGTASWAVSASQAISSSYAFSSSYSLSSSYALSASHAQTASYINPLRQDVQITGSLFITGSTTQIGDHTITGSIYLDDIGNGSIYFSGSGAPGRLVWNDADGTLDLGLKGGNVTLQIGQEQVVRVVNKTGINLTEAGYQVVRLSGAQGGRVKVALAKGDGDPNSLDTIGIVTENIPLNEEGFVTTMGLVRGINTTGNLQGETWTDGDALYLSPTTAGALTIYPPMAPSHSVRMGYVVQANPGNGSIFVKVDNGYELDELHNVLINTASLAYGDLLMRDGNNVWVNTKVLSGSYTLSGSLTTNDGVSVQTLTASVVSASQITGSLYGTSSYALTASYALFAANGGGTTIDTGSLLTTASFNAYTSSNTSQFAGTASFASTASYALNAGTTVDTGSLVTTSSFNLYTSSINTFTSSILNFTQSINNVTSSFVQNSQTSSFTPISSFNSYTSSINSFTSSTNTFTQSINNATSSFTTTSSLNTYTSSINLFTSSILTFTQSINNITGSFLTTGSYNTTQTISGSLIIDQNLTVLGTQSVQYITSSQLNISTNLITVNTATPAVRFGGLAVYDSGSTGTGRTGSILWDSQRDLWLYSNPSGSAYDSALVIMGPKNASVLGNEVGINTWYAAIGNGSHHMTSSAIYNSGSLIRLETNTEVTGSLIVSAGVTASLQGTSSWAINALTASFALNGGGGSTNTGSLLTTASVSLNTITFTKGDGSTFPITVDTGSGGSPVDTSIFITTASFNNYTGSSSSQFAGTASYTNDFDELDYLLVNSFRTLYNY